MGFGGSTGGGAPRVCAFCPPLFARVIAGSRSGWSVVELREFGPHDEASIAAYVAIDNACLVDAPWWHPNTLYRQTMRMRHGWDGEVPRYFLIHVEGEPAAVGIVELHTSEYDNLDLAWVVLAIRPEHRRRGYGTLAMVRAFGIARSMGRTKVGWFGWVGEQTEGFAKALGFEPKSVAVCRRQHLGELEPGLADRLYAEAEPHARDYELVRIVAPTPDELLPSLAEATAAINDAPLDDLEMEDEVFTPDRVRTYEHAQLGSGFRVYRVLARHRASGDLAGLSVVAVDSQDPRLGHQHDTSVVQSHRGHRLGQLLKADMMRWLAEVEPQLETVDTFNAESNDHMVGVNERLGYRVMGRELQFQDTI
jgi:GNAT superfamily N-acetyltransferase